MSMPGFTAEAALYTTTERHSLVARSMAGADGRAVIPQACSWWEWLGCGALTAGCAGGCVATGPTWPVCMGLCLVAAVAGWCRKCIGL